MMTNLIEIGLGFIACAIGLLLFLVAFAFAYAIYHHAKDNNQ